MKQARKKKKVMYFEQDGEEFCYPLEDHIATLEFAENNEIILFEAVRDFGGDGMWCMQEGEVVYRGENDCGRMCHNYKPRNGKNGICKELTWCFKQTGKKFKLTKNGLEPL